MYDKLYLTLHLMAGTQIMFSQMHLPTVKHLLQTLALSLHVKNLQCSIFVRFFALHNVVFLQLFSKVYLACNK